MRWQRFINLHFGDTEHVVAAAVARLTFSRAFEYSGVEGHTKEVRSYPEASCGIFSSKAAACRACKITATATSAEYGTDGSNIEILKCTAFCT